jgi:hypothetical protein
MNRLPTTEQQGKSRRMGCDDTVVSATLAWPAMHTMRSSGQLRILIIKGSDDGGSDLPGSELLSQIWDMMIKMQLAVLTAL